MFKIVLAKNEIQFGTFTPPKKHNRLEPSPTVTLTLANGCFRRRCLRYRWGYQPPKNEEHNHDNKQTANNDNEPVSSGRFYGLIHLRLAAKVDWSSIGFDVATIGAATNVASTLRAASGSARVLCVPECPFSFFAMLSCLRREFHSGGQS